MQRQPPNPPPTAHLLQRRVVSTASYAAEEAGRVLAPSKAERLRLYGTTVMPIPVALLPGESETQYEQSLKDWIAAERLAPLESYRDTPNQERSVRIKFAKTRARDFELGLHSRTPVRQEGFEVPQGLPLDMQRLYTKQFLDLDQYKRDVKDGKFKKLSAMSQLERTRLFGSPITPIVVPLARGETPAQYEQRFVEWLKRTLRTSLDQLRTSGKSKTTERHYRLLFAAANASGQERFVPVPPNRKRAREVTLGSVNDDESRTKRAEIAVTSRLPIERRVGPPKEEAATSRPSPEMAVGGGKSCVLIPPGDAPFHAVVAAYALCGCKQCLLKGIQMMTLKLAGGDDQANEERSMGEIQVSAESVSGMTDQEKAERPDETNTRSTMSGDGQQDVTTQLEFDVNDQLADQLAVENHGDSSDMTAHDHDLGEPEPDFTAPDVSVQPASSEEAKVAESTPDIQPALTELEQAEEDRPLPDAPVGDEYVDSRETRLFSPYERSNERIMEKEAALKASTARLNGIPPPSFEELTQLHDEIKAIKTQLEQEIDRRNDALDHLVVQMWSENVVGLEAKLKLSGACDMPPLQRGIHEQCYRLGKEINTLLVEVATTKRQLDLAISGGDGDHSGADLLATIQPLGDSLATAERKLADFEGRRRDTIVLLLRFDKRLREAVQQRLELAP